MIFLFESGEKSGGIGLNDFSFLTEKITFEEFVNEYRKTQRSEGFVPLSEVLLVLSEALQTGVITATSLGDKDLKKFKGGSSYRINGMELLATILNKGENIQ